MKFRMKGEYRAVPANSSGSGSPWYPWYFEENIHFTPKANGWLPTMIPNEE